MNTAIREPPSLRIAIAQPLMEWSGDRNAETMVAFLELAAGAGARVCVFPELAIPGFHRGIRELAKPALLTAWIASVRATCARHRIGAVFGAPTIDTDGRIFNSALLLDDRGVVRGVVHKTGLTAPEATFFAPALQRPVIDIFGRRCSAVLCREIADLDAVSEQFADDKPQLIFWPGLMGPEQGDEGEETPRHVRQAQEMSVRFGACIVQANWPNSLNYPEKSATAGRSVVVAPSGEVALALPLAEPGLAVFDLGQTSFRWLPQ